MTDEDVGQIGGRRELLLEKLRERCGFTAQEASEQVEDWAQRAGLSMAAPPGSTQQTSPPLHEPRQGDI